MHITDTVGLLPPFGPVGHIFTMSFYISVDLIIMDNTRKNSTARSYWSRKRQIKRNVYHHMQAITATASGKNAENNTDNNIDNDIVATGNNNIDSTGNELFEHLNKISANVDPATGGDDIDGGIVHETGDIFNDNMQIGSCCSS